jgi:Fe-S-cluster containining protein
MPPRDFKCKQCGNCCLNLHDAYSNVADDADVKRWEGEGREDILEYVAHIEFGKQRVCSDIWINPRTGESVSRCPWLRKLPRQNKYICRIQDVKPKHCREYPKSRKHADEAGCPGFKR